jgi:hypothetical protein
MGPHRFLAFLAVLGAFAFGAGVGSLWRESSTTCALAGVLLEDIRTLLVDGQAVVSDPLLEYAIGSEDSFLTRIELERELAHRILARFGRFHLSLGFTMDLGRLASLQNGSLQAELGSLGLWSRAMHPAPETEDLLARLAPLAKAGAPGIAAGLRGLPAASEPWYSDPAAARARLRELADSDHRRLEEARSRLPAIRSELDSESQVYCRSLLSLHRMALVQDAQKQACANGDSAHGKARGGPACGKAALLRFQAEVEQLEKVRSLNERKLKLKWGDKLYAGIHCE